MILDSRQFPANQWNIIGIYLVANESPVEPVGRKCRGPASQERIENGFPSQGEHPDKTGRKLFWEHRLVTHLAGASEAPVRKVELFPFLLGQL